MTSAVSSMIVADRSKTMQPTTMKLTSRLAASASLALAVALLPGVARADDASKPGPRAEALFKEARTLLDAKKYDEACPKLAESQRLDPGAGTLLALALCHEGQGKTATAWAELDEAAKMGKKVGRQDLASAAEKRARLMEPNLSKLVIRMPKDGAAKQDLADLTVKVDGAKISPDDFGAPFAVDPGEHRVEASAKGKAPRSYVVRLSGAGTVEIVIDKLEDAPAPAAVVAPEPAPKKKAPVDVAPLTEPPPVGGEARSSGGAQRVFGLVLAGVGVGGLGAGAYFGGKALTESQQATCNGPCAEGVETANDRAKRSTTNAIIAASSGTVALAAGVIIYLTAPSNTSSARGAAPSKKATARVVPEAGPQQAGLSLVGTF